MQNDKELKNLILQLADLLTEVQKQQNETKCTVEKYHKVNMQKFSKLIEFNEICDMTNQVFERRISSIEQKLTKLVEKMK